MQEPTSTSQSDSGQMYMSRRERRAHMRAARGGASSPWLRRLFLWGGSMLLLVLLGWGMVVLSRSTPLPTDGGVLADAVSDRDNILGPSDAPVTLVEYSDFQCPACAAFQPVVKQALEDPLLKDKVRFVYRSFPLTNIHANATLAARAAQAAALQGKFWEMHDALFEGQTSWARLSDAGARDVFRGYASTIGLDVDAYTAALDSDAIREHVAWDSDSAERSAVNSTPSFFVNGNRMSQPQSYEEFRQNLINAANANP